MHQDWRRWHTVDHGRLERSRATVSHRASLATTTAPVTSSAYRATPTRSVDTHGRKPSNDYYRHDGRRDDCARHGNRSTCGGRRLLPRGRTTSQGGEQGRQ